MIFSHFHICSHFRSQLLKSNADARSIYISIYFYRSSNGPHCRNAKSPCRVGYPCLSTRWNEMQRHMRYVTHADNRRCTNMKFFAAVVNTYAKVEQEFEDFAAALDNSTRGKGRGRGFVSLLSLLEVYANAENIFSHPGILTETSAKRRSPRSGEGQRGSSGTRSASCPTPSCGGSTFVKRCDSERFAKSDDKMP